MLEVIFIVPMFLLLMLPGR